MRRRPQPRPDFHALSTVLVLGAVIGFAPQQARAATATATMAVSATVLSVCTITALPLVFGNYTGVLLEATSTLTVTCTATTTYNVGLDPGLATGATVSTRQMTNGASGLSYALFRDSARTLNWGVTIGTDTSAGTASGLPQSLTVYGKVPAGQFVTPGVYADVITATVTY